MTKTRNIVFLADCDAEALNLVGPLEIFDAATKLGDPRVPRYHTEVLVPEAGAIRCSNGLSILAPRSLRSHRGPIDTLVVVGGFGVWNASRDEVLLRWIRRAAGRARRVASICAGAFLLAAAGLLDEKRATTHWALCKRLQATYPSTRVDTDLVFVRDGNVWTSAGVVSGMDMCLALVAEDLDRRAAAEIAHWLVMPLQRAGGQSQLSALLSAQLAEREPLREIAAWVGEHPEAHHPVASLAKRAGMSVRNFARAFRRELGTTPRAYVEKVRLEAAQRALEQGAEPIAAVARRAGFGTTETLERLFQRALGVTPTVYRQTRRGTGTEGRRGRALH
jgi:transcriptional regulator GlxA family with amidase domain